MAQGGDITLNNGEGKAAFAFSPALLHTTTCVCVRARARVGGMKGDKCADSMFYCPHLHRRRMQHLP